MIFQTKQSAFEERAKICVVLFECKMQQCVGGVYLLLVAFPINCASSIA